MTPNTALERRERDSFHSNRFQSGCLCSHTFFRWLVLSFSLGWNHQHQRKHCQSRKFNLFLLLQIKEWRKLISQEKKYIQNKSTKTHTPADSRLQGQWHSRAAPALYFIFNLLRWRISWPLALYNLVGGEMALSHPRSDPPHRDNG